MLNKKGGAGVDRERIEDYESALYERIADLHQRLKDGRYRAQPVRLTRIPKGTSGFRSLGIPTVEDRLVQAATARRLSAIFEPQFLDCSYGYRPSRSAHDSLRSLRGQVIGGKVMHIFEADIRSYFDRVNHHWLRQMLRQRIADKTVLRLIDKWLRAGVMDGGLLSQRVEGVFHLYKLHGSINWVRTTDELVEVEVEVEVEVSPDPNSAAPIYPANGKYQQSYIQPHLELISQYLAALRELNTISPSTDC